MRTLLGAWLLVVGVSVLPVYPARAARRDAPDAAALRRLADDFQRQRTAGQGAAYQRLLTSPAPADALLRSIPGTALQYVDDRGMPRYYVTDNVNAAGTISTDDVQPGGSGGFDLDGSGTPPGRLGMWDSGAVRTTHVEFGGRAQQMDTPTALSPHSTHVAGTLIASGVDPLARGMSPAAYLQCWDYSGDLIEMPAAAAAGMRLSNHSYSPACGWALNGTTWYWYGDATVSATEDYGFGFYGSDAQAWDQIAYAAPSYLIVGSAGNNRADTGPGDDGFHYYWNGTSWTSSTAPRDPDGGATGYDTIPWTKNAKNILAVGAVEDLPDGYAGPESVVMTAFSSWGPCDDGRIKPDLCANGVALWSSLSGSDTAHDYYTGTSMSSPGVTGSLNLLVDEWQATHAGDLPRAATLKAIALHTASECGPADGPDYQFGWGLMNTLEAARLVAADAADSAAHHVVEAALANTSADHYYFLVSAPESVRFTISWTDVPHQSMGLWVDNPTRTLVNDLDLRLSDGSTQWEPWVLDPSQPDAPATTGDNAVDNTEQIVVASLPPGSYTLTVTHKGALVSAPQAYTLVGSVALSTVFPPVAVPATGLSASGSGPNPFSHSTSIAFRMTLEGPVSLRVFDIRGRLVRTLAHGTRFARGNQRLLWDGRRDDGRPVASGVYFARLEAGASSRVDKLVRVLTR